MQLKVGTLLVDETIRVRRLRGLSESGRASRDGYAQSGEDVRLPGTGITVALRRLRSQKSDDVSSCEASTCRNGIATERFAKRYNDEQRGARRVAEKPLIGISASALRTLR